MRFNEDYRFKIPAILHVTRLGYQYLFPKGTKWGTSTDTFSDQFYEDIDRIDFELDQADFSRLCDEVSSDLKKFHYKVELVQFMIQKNLRQDPRLSERRYWLLPMLNENRGE